MIGKESAAITGVAIRARSRERAIADRVPIIVETTPTDTAIWRLLRNEFQNSSRSNRTSYHLKLKVPSGNEASALSPNEKRTTRKSGVTMNSITTARKTRHAGSEAGLTEVSRRR